MEIDQKKEGENLLLSLQAQEFGLLLSRGGSKPSHFLAEFPNVQKAEFCICLPRTHFSVIIAVRVYKVGDRGGIAPTAAATSVRGEREGF